MEFQKTRVEPLKEITVVKKRDAAGTKQYKDLSKKGLLNAQVTTNYFKPVEN